MQMQADIAGLEVIRPLFRETTALGAAYAAGLAVGFWDSLDALRALWKVDRVFSPEITPEEREKKYEKWQKAIEKSRGWIEEEQELIRLRKGGVIVTNPDTLARYDRGESENLRGGS
jgi:glycerol kinase